MSNYFSGIVVERASINLSTLSGTVWLLLLPTMTRVSSLAPATSGRRVADADAAVCEGGRASGSGAGIGGSWPRPRRHVAAHYLLRLIELPNLRETTDGRTNPSSPSPFSRIKSPQDCGRGASGARLAAEVA